MQSTVVVNFLVGYLAFAAVPALAGPADDAARAFANGKALLAEAKFDGALQAFRTAAKADAGNQDYRQTYSMLRQVVRMREEIEKEQDSEQWMSIARALRAFYHEHRIYSESLPLDREIHERHLAPDSAAMLAETLLALGKNTEAGELLRNVGEKEATPRTTVLLGLSLARQGRIDEAKAAAMKAGVDQDAGPRVFYELARLHALTGESKAALEALTRSFELTPPSQVDALKADAKACEDFSTFADSSDFNEVLKTQSTVKESKCSKGPGCDKCPKRAKCGKNQKTTP
jgi:tetratricopeptide (TPR) repeat protein